VKASDQATDAVVAQRKLLAMTKKVDEIVPEQADEVKAAGYQAGEEAARMANPQQGGGIS
jgi:hypothetical protein